MLNRLSGYPTVLLPKCSLLSSLELAFAGSFFVAASLVVPLPSFPRLVYFFFSRAFYFFYLMRVRFCLFCVILLSLHFRSVLSFLECSMSISSKSADKLTPSEVSLLVDALRDKIKSHERAARASSGEIADAHTRAAANLQNFIARLHSHNLEF